MYVLQTPDDGLESQFEQTWFTPNQKTFTFMVQACNDAHIALSGIPGDLSKEIYEVIIGGGGNTRSFIRKGFMVSGDVDVVNQVS